SWAQWLRHSAQCSALAGVPAAWRSDMQRLARAMNLRARAGLRVSARVSGPCTLGWWRPVILLPVSAIDKLPREQLRALLAHELAHIRRHDYAINLVQRGVEAAFFFHPAVWWLSRQVSEVREQCCDDAAAAVCGDRAGYARALVELAAWQSSAALPAGALAAAGGSLSHRVGRLLGHAGNARPCAWRTAMAMVLVAASGLWLLGAAAGMGAQTMPPLQPPPTPPAAAVALRLMPPVRHLLSAARRAPAARRAAPAVVSVAPRPAPAPVQTAVVALRLSTVEACIAAPAWVPQRLPSGLTAWRLEIVPRCIPVIRPVEVLVITSSI
ncbi:MAG: M56 family metallopeptidase, partial [Terriglobales bacterium]